MIERLPWLLNGTLEGEERQTVERHLEQCPSCRAERRLTAEAGLLFDVHPEAGEIVRWAADGLEPEGAAASHVELCADCREALALARASAELRAAPAPVSGRPAPATRARLAPWRMAAGLAAAAALAAFAWALLAARETARLGGELEAAAGERSRLSAEVAAERGRVASAQASAAEASERLESALAARPNPEVLELVSEEEVLRGGSREVAEARPGDLLLLLHGGGTGPRPELRALLLDGEGRTVATVGGLRRGRHGAFALQLPLAGLAPGPLLVRLETVAPLPRKVATFRLRIAAPAAPAPR